MSAELDVLFRPLAVGRSTLRNRLVSVPHGNSYGFDGIPLASHVAYVRHIAETTAGLIVLGATAIHQTTYRPPLFSLFDDRALPRLREMAAAAHESGALIVSQLGHSGRHATVTQPGLALWAPSPEPPGPSGAAFATLGPEELVEVRAAYVDAARRALAAGCDGVEIHAAHGYLMQQFLSPYYNRRADAYGGALENRLRLLAEILERVRVAAGEHLVGVRLGAGDDRAGGLAWPDVLEVAKHLAGRGLVDYVSLAASAQKARYVKDGSFPRGGLREQARDLRAAIGVPVIVSQRIDAPALAADIIATGDADLVALGRGLVADPDWGAKVRRGAAALIRPCVLCLEGCRRTADAVVAGSVTCSVNPTAYGIEPVAHAPRTAPRPQRVIVVGGGPAGCEAALGAAALGCDVVLLERLVRLGGRARIAGAAPHREAWARYADWLHSAVVASGLDVRCGIEATGEVIAQFRADLIIVATGSVMPRPPTAAWTTDELLAAGRPPETWRTAAVVDPYGRWDAVSAVELLCAAGVRVTYLTSLDEAAANVPEESRDGVVARFARSGVETIVGADLASPRVLAGGPAGVVAAGEEVADPASAAWSFDVPVVRVGDCRSPRGLATATREGWLAARALR